MDGQTPETAVDLRTFLHHAHGYALQLLNGGQIYVKVGDQLLAALEQGHLVNPSFVAASQVNHLPLFPTVGATSYITRAAPFLIGEARYLPFLTAGLREICLLDANFVQYTAGLQPPPKPEPAPPQNSPAAEATPAEAVPPVISPAAATPAEPETTAEQLFGHIKKFMDATLRPSWFHFSMHGRKFRGLVEPNEVRLPTLLIFTSHPLQFSLMPPFPKMLESAIQGIAPGKYVRIEPPRPRIGLNNKILIMLEADALRALQPLPRESFGAPRRLRKIRSEADEETPSNLPEAPGKGPEEPIIPPKKPTAREITAAAAAAAAAVAAAKEIFPPENYDSEYMLAQGLKELTEYPRGRRRFTFKGRPFVAIARSHQIPSAPTMISHTLEFSDPLRAGTLSDELERGMLYIESGEAIRIRILGDRDEEKNIFILQEDPALLNELEAQLREQSPARERLKEKMQSQQRNAAITINRV